MFRVLVTGLKSGEANVLILQDIGMFRHQIVLDNFISRVISKSSYKEDPGAIPLGKEIKIAITPVYGNDAADRQGKIRGHGDIMVLAIRDYGKVR